MLSALGGNGLREYVSFRAGLIEALYIWSFAWGYQSTRSAAIRMTHFIFLQMLSFYALDTRCSSVCGDCRSTRPVRLKYWRNPKKLHLSKEKIPVLALSHSDLTLLTL